MEKKDNINYILKAEGHSLTLKGAYKAGKNIKCRKTKVKNSRIPLTVLINYNFGLLKFKIDEDILWFKLGEQYYIEPKLAKVITNNDLELIIDDLKHDSEEYNRKKQNEVKNKKKKKS